MIISKTKYVNVTKDFPLMFDCDGGNDTDNLEDAYFYDSEVEVKNDLDSFDEPEMRQILKVKITYEF